MNELKLDQVLRDQLSIDSLWQPSPELTFGPDTHPEKTYLMIVLHGRGDSALGWRDFRDELGIENLSAILLNAPERYYLGYSWYGHPPDQLPGILRSRELLDRVLPEIHRQGFPPERCFLLGFSQGCLMTLEFGGRYQKRLAGYIGLSGYCYDPSSLVKEASSEALAGDWLITHGTEDDVLSVGRTRAQIDELKRGGFPIDYREYDKMHTLDRDAEVPEIREWISERMRSPTRTR